MREIKFRGYSKAFGMMFTNDMLEMATASMVDICKKELKKIDPQATEIQMGLFLPTYDEDLILMQYTGFKDKNGVEIYEGDIICCPRRNDTRGIVKFGDYRNPCDSNITKHQGFYIDFCGESKDYYRKDLGYWARLSEVTGNIYENQNLLK